MAVFIDAARQAILKDRYEYEEKYGYLWFSRSGNPEIKDAIKIDESRRDALKGIINMRKTQDSLSPGNDEGRSPVDHEAHEKHKRSPKDDEKETREPKIWGGAVILGKNLEEIATDMASDIFWLVNGGLIGARSSYKISRGWFKRRFPHLPKDVADELRPFIDVNLYDNPIAMYIYSYYCVPKDSSGWADDNAKTIAKHYECVQLARFLEGRGVF